MNAGEISNQRIRKEKQSLGTDDWDVTPSRADDAGLKIAYKRDRHLPRAGGGGLYAYNGYGCWRWYPGIYGYVRVWVC